MDALETRFLLDNRVGLDKTRLRLHAHAIGIREEGARERERLRRDLRA